MDQTFRNKQTFRSKNNLRTKSKSKIIKGVELPKPFTKTLTKTTKNNMNKMNKTKKNSNKIIKRSNTQPIIEFPDEPLNPELNMGFDLDLDLDFPFTGMEATFEDMSNENPQIMISGYSYSSTYQNGQQLEEESKLHIKNDQGYYMHRDTTGKVTKKVLKPNEIDEFICQSFNKSGLPCPYKAKYIQSGGKAVCGYHKTQQISDK